MSVEHRAVEDRGLPYARAEAYALDHRSPAVIELSPSPTPPGSSRG